MRAAAVILSAPSVPPSEKRRINASAKIGTTRLLRVRECVCELLILFPKKCDILGVHCRAQFG
jgi:hypothetical protein